MTARRVVIFGPDGLWTGRAICGNEETIAANLSDGEVAINAVDHPHAKRLVDGELVDYRPSAPDDEHEWDDADKRWRIKLAVRQAHGRRLEALGSIEQLERQQARAIREHAIGRGGPPAQLKKRLEDIDDQITELRKALT